MKIKLTKDRLLVTLEEPKEKTASGIYIPRTASLEANPAAVIFATGPLVSDDRLVAGAKVLLRRGSGEEILHEEEKFLLIREDDVYGLIPEEEEK